MSNDYYTAATIARLSQARSSEENSDRAAVEAAFDLLPPIASINQNRVAFYTAGGTANALTVTMSPTLTSYVTGLRLTVLLSATNTGGATLNVDGLGARNIKLITGSLVEAGELESGTIIDLIYNGTDFFVSSPTQRLVSGIANINDPITFGDSVTVTDGPLTVESAVAGNVLIRTKAQDGSPSGFQIYDHTAGAYRSVLVNDGTDRIEVGVGGWPDQRFLGTWTFNSLMGCNNVDLNGGEIDGTAIGANSASTGRFTTVTGTGAASFGSMTVTGATSLATLSTSGLATLNSLTVTGASNVAAITATGAANFTTVTGTGAGAFGSMTVTGNTQTATLTTTGLATMDDMAVGGDITLTGHTFAIVNGAFSHTSALGITADFTTSVDNGNDAELRLTKARGGSGTLTGVQVNDDLGTVRFRGYDGTAYFGAASITAKARSATAPFEAELIYSAHTHEINGILDLGQVSNADALSPLLLDEDDLTSDSATQAATQQSIKAYVAAQLAAEKYRSTAQTISVSSLIQLTHGLGAIPSHVSLHLKCLAAEHGYAIDDEIIVSPNGSNTGSNRCTSVIVTSTNIDIRYSSDVSAFQSANKTTGAVAGLTNARWELYVTATL